jgi:hypothetical protein
MSSPTRNLSAVEIMNNEREARIKLYITPPSDEEPTPEIIVENVPEQPVKNEEFECRFPVQKSRISYLCGCTLI